MIAHVAVYDIDMTEEFWNDYERAPSYIKGRMERLIDMILELGSFPNSMRVRHTFLENGLVMGNVTQKKRAYRILFWLNETTGIITLHRLLTHDERDFYLRVQQN